MMQICVSFNHALAKRTCQLLTFAHVISHITLKYKNLTNLEEHDYVLSYFIKKNAYLTGVIVLRSNDYLIILQELNKYGSLYPTFYQKYILVYVISHKT